MTLELRRGREAFFSCFKNVTYSLMGFPKQSLLYNSFLDVEENYPSFLLSSPRGSGDCWFYLSSKTHLSVHWTFYVYKTHSLLMLPDDPVMDWSYNAVPRTLCRCYLSKQPAVLSPSLSSFLPQFSPSSCSSLGDFPSLAVLKVKSHFSLHWAQLQLATGFRCAALSHSGALRVQPAAPTIDYVSRVLKNQASF